MQEQASESPLRSKSALSNLTNLQLTASPQSFSPPTKSPQRQETGHFNQQRKSVALEQENQMLKTQIEMLKTMLLGVCREKNLQIPATLMQESAENVSLLDLQMLMQVLMMSPNQQQQQQQKSPSPFKHSLPYQQNYHNTKNQAFMQMNDLSAINQKDENSISKFSICSSPSKSQSRRKRSQRKSSPKKLAGYCLDSRMRESPNFREELPLQIQYRKPTTDDTLVFDKSMDIIQNKEVRQSVLEIENHINHSIIVEDDSHTHQQHNSSQIQIKYHKMLEELENESANPVIIQEEEDQMVTPLKQIKTIDCCVQPLEGDLPKGSMHHKNQLSSHYETKHYYENELNNLKSELEQFEQEEEKILSLLVSSHKPSQEVTQVLIENPEVVLLKEELQEELLDSHKKTQKDCESFQYVSGHAIEEYHQTMKAELSQEQMMQNLQDAYLELQCIQEEDDEDNFMRPIKIISPTNKPIEENNIASYRRKSQERYNRTPLQDERQGALPMVSPIRYEAPQFGMFSADKQGINDRSPYCDRYVHHHKKSSQQSSIDQSQSKKSTLRATSSIINQRQKSTSKPRQNSHKSPSKFTVKNLLTVMAHDKSPNTHLRKSYQRTEESIDHDKKRMETLEKLAKHESMVKGLTQQVEPEEEDHYHHQGRLMSEEDEVRMQDADDKMTKDQFYGLYSLEKSEQLKYQRVQSIKKAEELLQQFMNESQSSKRPEFIQTKNVSVIEKWEPSEVVQQQYQPETIVLNEVSFQDSKGNQSSKQNVRESTRSSLVSHQIYYNDLVNLELSPEPKQITIDMQTCNFQTFDIPLSVNSMTPQELTVHQTPQQALHHHQPSDDYESYLSQTQQLNNRRKSFESTTCSSKLTTLLLQPKAKQLQQRKPIPQTKDLALNHYQSFSSAQKKHNKSSEYSNVTLASMQTPSNTNAKIRQMQQERKVEEPGFIKGISTGLIDVEMLYEHRSKSVVKKREELLKKKQMDTLSKIEARNTKVDNFKQTRNLNRLQSNQRVNTSSENLKQQQMQQQYHSKQKSRISFDSSSHTPIRTKSEANKTISSTYHSNHTESLKKSASKNQIKFEKRDKPVVNEYQQAQKSIITAPSAMQTPVNMMKNYVPSSNQSKSSKLMSECSSYRRRQEELDYKNSTQKSASKSQSTCNMLYKKQQLKSSIVNRTIRMHHQPKEYHQLKQEHQRLKQALQQTIELHCEQSTSGSTQSFIMQKLSQQQKQANQNKLKSLVPQKALNSSRSTSKINTVNKDVVKAHQQQQYQTIQVVSVDDDDDEDIVGQTQAQRECANCVRLLSKGLSTDFCLEHYGTPRYIDD